MPKLSKKFLPLLVAVSLVLTYFNWPPVYADISSCSASISPHTVTPSTSTDFQFQINNTDVNPTHRIKITRPSSNFTITGYSVGGWAVGMTNDYLTLGGGTISPSESLDLVVVAASGGSEVPSADWTVEVSDDYGGANPFSCSGDLDTAISGQAPDSTPPTISDISPSALTSTSITISWTTDEPATSRIYYGLDEDYGSEKENFTLKTSHSLTLSNLTPNTGYHYQIESVDAVGNTGYSEDNTFLTPLYSATPTLSPGTAPGQKKLIQTEKIPPTIKISTLLNQPFKEVPKIAGEAADNSGVYSIEYSTDGGKNWLPADKVGSLGGKEVKFEFTPKNLEDGDYITLARVTDTSGNTAVSDKQTLVIDRLPPLVGGSVVAIGPQILEPSNQGVLFSIAGVDQKITLAATGGPTSINLMAKNATSGRESSLFSLTKSVDTGLWSGILSFKKAGTYSLVANSTDGAGNKLTRELSTVFIKNLPRVLNKDNGQPVEKAKLTLYYLEPESKTWVVWDGAPYGQENPQETSSDGSYRLLVPVGKYYLKVEKTGFQTLISEMFEVDKPTPLTSDINLKETFKIDLGLGKLSLPSFSVQKITINPETNKSPKTLQEKSLVSKEVPLFSIPSTNGQEVNSVSLRGKPTVISFITTWSPAAKEQLPMLESLQKNHDINVVPISTFENLAKVAVYTKIAGYDLDILIDKDGQTPEAFNLQSLPTHYFVSRRGIIKKVLVGVLSKEEILNSLGGL